MKKIAIGLALAALAAGGTVYAAGGMGQRGHGMRMMDANGDGEVTRAEALSAAEQRFAKMDINKDGKLDPADREARHAAHFDTMDTDKDGQISRAEFTAAHALRQGAGGPGGGVSEHRMGGHRMGHRGKGGGMMMRMADANKDGAVSAAEMTSTALAQFDRSDTNRDGKLTAAEMQAAHAAMRERMQERMNGGQQGHGDHAAPPAKTN